MGKTSKVIRKESKSITDEIICAKEPTRGQTMDILSVFDGPNNYKQYYTAFLCCAQKDLETFGLPFHVMLEKMGFRIFLPPRDLVLTGPLYENLARALEERCNGKIIVVLSANYVSSEECLFLTYFARVLDPDSRSRNIIPVQIDKDIGELPSVLKGMSIIRYNQAFRLGWLKQKLIDAISA
ncbi:myeloid differentiation primary response protein MyD88-like [Physella acuta]|uniref:myeloid differentiation primary response protein MyD88-like n=1 Tax=Physella acuta TaxID=109671 RepID=UPI0027DB472B|nr:myeloid differentiation primary response protein MyD88-like [Physella acuta]